VTSTINVFKAQRLVLFDVVQEHDYSFTGAGDHMIPDKVKLYNNQARAACSTCIIFSSLRAPMSHPSDSTATIVSSIIGRKVENGENVIAIHDFRSSYWWSMTGAGVAAYRAYLTSTGYQNIPIIFDKPNRHGFTYVSSESEFNAATAAAKALALPCGCFTTAPVSICRRPRCSHNSTQQKPQSLSQWRHHSLGSRRAPVSLISQHPE
jgi:hypothetical protein